MTQVTIAYLFAAALAATVVYIVLPALTTGVDAYSTLAAAM